MITELGDCAGGVLRSVDALCIGFGAAGCVCGLLVDVLGEVVLRKHLQQCLPCVSTLEGLAVGKVIHMGESIPAIQDPCVESSPLVSPHPHHPPSSCQWLQKDLPGLGFLEFTGQFSSLFC